MKLMDAPGSSGPRHSRRISLGLGALIPTALLAACGSGASSGSSETAVRVDPRTAPLPGNTQEGAAFASWVRSTDPERKYIVDAFVRDDSTLGVVVNPGMTKGQTQQAMGSLLNGMQRTFGNRPLQVITYYTSGDELARMVWDPRDGKAVTTWKD